MFAQWRKMPFIIINVVCDQTKHAVERKKNHFVVLYFCLPSSKRPGLVIGTTSCFCITITYLYQSFSTMLSQVQSSMNCLYQKCLTKQWAGCCLTDVQCQWKQPTIDHETNSRYLQQTMTDNGWTFCSTSSSLTTRQQHNSHLYNIKIMLSLTI